MQKDEIADILKEIGVFLELKGENPFKTRAYQNGARTLENLAEPLEPLIAEERLGSIKGIGKALAEKITELATTGRLAYYDELKASIPDGLIAMLNIPGLGPKKVKTVYSKLGIETVEALEQACKGSQ
ncbi:MAG: histidinol-phosphatase, partial [Verrucomicrobia bacterium]|nr:histidinol-phosphatase [Verrucomicrobiota bacterium]